MVALVLSLILADRVQIMVETVMIMAIVRMIIVMKMVMMDQKQKTKTKQKTQLIMMTAIRQLKKAINKPFNRSIHPIHKTQQFQLNHNLGFFRLFQIRAVLSIQNHQSARQTKTVTVHQDLATTQRIIVSLAVNALTDLADTTTTRAVSVFQIVHMDSI
jgi:hypothetical protein